MQTLPLVLDGAMGTRLIKAGMPTGCCTEKWIVDNQSVAEQIVKSYIEAGSDIIYAPTMLANYPSLKGYGLETQMYDYNATIVKLCKKWVGNKKVLVAGGMSSTGLILMPYGEADFLEVVGYYAEQAMALKDGGADLIVVETMSSLAECRAAVIGARQANLPILVSITVNENGVTMFGSKALPALITLQGMGIAAFGLNCSFGPDKMLSIVSELSSYAEIPIFVKPNSGFPDLSPQQFTAKVEELMVAGASIVGGCCGTDEHYIALLRDMVTSFDITKVKIDRTSCELILANNGNIYFIDHEVEFSKPILCEIDMADKLIQNSDNDSEIALIQIDSIDDAINFSNNVHLLDGPCALVSNNEEALEFALIYYTGRAIIASICDIERTMLENLAKYYSAVII